MHLHTLDFIIMAIYLAGLVGVGIFFAGRQKDKLTYFLSGRRAHWFIAGISVIATLLSTMSFLAVPGEMIRYGIGLFTSLLAFVAVIPLLTRLIIPFLMKLSVTSIYEHIEHRFNLPTRLLAASAFVFSRIIWIGMVTYSASFAIAAMTGWSVPWLIVVVGGITTFYTTAGGINAVMWGDLVQFFVLLGGAVFVPCYIAFVTAAGPLVWWETFSAAGRAQVPIYSLDPTVRITMVGIICSSIVWNTCTHGADQVAAQRYLSTPSVAKARHAVWISALANVGMILLLAVVGLALFHFFHLRSGLPVQAFQEQIAPEADKIFPRFIAAELPAGISGLILIALLAAAMSSLSSGINSITSVVITDFFDRFRLFAKQAGSLNTAKTVGVATGLLGIASALSINRFMATGEWNLVELMERGNHLFVAPLGVLFFSGFLIPRADGRAAMGGFVAGVATSVSISFSKEIYGLEAPISFAWNMPCSFVVSLLATYLLSLGFHCNVAKPGRDPKPA